jgi:ribosomal protein S18 acetylase RimI-like enzyme
LEALKSDPSAFSSSVEEESALSEEEWKRRTKNALFAVSDGTLVGMIVCVFSERTKIRHVADIFGVYVSTDYRGKGVGTRLLERTLSMIHRNKRIVKVELAVNPEQRAAVRMYEKAGFVVVGRGTKEIRVGRRFFDMLYMEKLL